jgi:hypothetical protein
MGTPAELVRKVYRLKRLCIEKPNRAGGFLRETGANYQNSLFPFLTLSEAASFLAKTNGKMSEVEMDKFNQEFAQWVGSSYDYKEKQFDAYGMAEYSFKNFKVHSRSIIPTAE